ncbi:DUF559 domain-containing protein [Nigerium massiliense]|uniref:DUF559 domain-containing protein n=1 Tax=Nigerium massiliense TaxID=1522317 RepID=UPI0012FE788C|nr:DUF559 domain-containing protein [Nigerium massiliense]
MADPDAVITGRAAAHLTWWPQLSARTLSATRASAAARAPGFDFHRRRIDPELVTQYGGLRVTTVALTVLDLIPELGGAAIDEALRRRVVTLQELWVALDATPNRRGNVRRRMLLHDSRDQPWSEAERLLHQVMRGVTLPCRWVSNHRVDVAHEGSAGAPPTIAHYYLDVALPDLLLDIEVDGHEFHSSRESFSRDKRRDAHLASDGWQVVRISALQLMTEPAEVRARVQSIVRQRHALFRQGQPVLAAA